MKLFAESELFQALQVQLAKMKKEIASEDRNYLLNANETQLVRYFVEKYRLEPLTINFEGVTASDREEQIPAEQFPHDFRVTRGKRYPKQVVTYHVPFGGDEQLLRMSPSTRSLNHYEVSIRDNAVCFDIINWRNDPETITREYESFLDYLRSHAEYTQRDVTAYNESLEYEVTQAIRQRKDELLKKSNLLAALGVPIRESPSVPSTFATPAPKKKVLIAKPVSSTAPFVPDPTLDESTYAEILRIIYETGIEIERSGRGHPYSALNPTPLG